MQQNLPFNFKEVFKLTNLGLNPELFKFGSVTFESQKYICVKDQAVSKLVNNICRIAPSLTRQNNLRSRGSQ